MAQKVPMREFTGGLEAKLSGAASALLAVGAVATALWVGVALMGPPNTGPLSADPATAAAEVAWAAEWSIGMFLVQNVAMAVNLMLTAWIWYIFFRSGAQHLRKLKQRAGLPYDGARLALPPTSSETA